MTHDRFPAEALARVLDHFWCDDREDFENAPRPGHVFVGLVRLQAWLSRLEDNRGADNSEANEVG
jgi:hypothetical protein